MQTADRKLRAVPSIRVKMGGPEFRDRQLSQLLLKRERRMQLYQPRRGVGSEERTEDAGGGGYRIDDPPEGL